MEIIHNINLFQLRTLNIKYKYKFQMHNYKKIIINLME